MQTYARCSEQYRLQKVEKVPELQTAWAPQGNAFHDGMEAWEKSGRQLTAQEVADFAVASYDDRIAAGREQAPDDSGWLTGGRTRPQVDIDRRRDRVVEQVHGYIKYSLDNEHLFRPATLPDGRPAVEVPFTITLNGVTVRGAIDLVLEWHDGALTIRDLKTGNKLPNDPLQLSFYGLGWKRLFGDVIEYGDYFICKNNAPTQPYYLLNYSEEYIGAWLEMFDRSERQGLYIPNGGDHCRVCSVRPYCPLMGDPEKARANLAANLKMSNYNESETE